MTAHLLDGARPAYEDVVRRGRAHRFVHVRHSSQAFALNLLAPLSPHGRALFLSRVGWETAGPGPACFEWEDEQNLLAEGGRNARHVTQVDAAFRGLTTGGRRVGALVEVKFTETGFSGCSAYEHPENPHRDVCGRTGLFGGESGACWQLRDKGAGRRTYDTYLAGSVVEPDQARDGGCAVRTGLNQPMRNLALAHSLLDRGDLDEVAFVVVAPAGHAEVWRRTGELRAVFPDSDRRRVVGITAEEVAGMHDDGGDGMRRRYPTLEAS